MADIIPHRAIALIGSGVIDLDSDTMVATLYTSSATFTSESEDYSATNELATANGYTQLNEAITGQSIIVNDTDNRAQFDIGDITWTASGGDIGPARYCAVVDTQGGLNKYVYIMDFVTDKTANDGTDFKITIDASGLFLMYQF